MGIDLQLRHIGYIEWLGFSDLSRKETLLCQALSIINRPLVAHSIRMKDFYYIDTDEIPGFFLLLKNHIFIAPSGDTIFIFPV